MNCPSLADLPIGQYRTRAMHAGNAIHETHWGIGTGWDAESVAMAYCIDAPGTIPAGATRHLPDAFRADGTPIITPVRIARP